ncbi:PIR Superfamily Protein [Plasmodium ovale wallikeri]|uniref:PIR Superfamily Protein n=2 Tax=Plasmodium ovale TaxID=36330 RepID=A0A1A9APS5_PLAOA|nr:PIR Superfamily Protein [Plasmodium ovale wallikeri]SBT58100.1 PIR Superfamily Protein [Plasmodium ovale wallikeri]SBT75092.1 PIR protein [Plasmodium ovale]
MGNEEDPDIRELQSEIIYHKLKNNPKDYTKDTSDFWKTTISKHPMKVLDIFPTLVKGIYFVSTMNEGEYAFYDERWNYLYFWTGIKVIENSEDPEDLEDSDSSYFSQLMNLLKMVRSYTDKKKVPYDKNMLMINTDEFQNLKKIYDYLQNYQTIQLRIGSTGNASCTPRYKDYLNNTHNLYTSEKKKCEDNSSNYCKTVNSFVHTYGKNFMTKLSCDGMKDPTRKLESHEGRRDYVPSASQHHLHENGAQESHSPSGQGQDSVNIVVDPRDIPSPSGSISAASTVFPLLGTASLLFFFVNFTPLGSRLHNNIFRKQITGNNEEEAQEMLEHSYEHSHGNIEENMYQISYHNM